MHPRRDLVIGIVAGVALGIGAVILFLFLESRSAIDEPSISGRGLRVTAPKPPRRAPHRPHVTKVRVKSGGPAGTIPDIRAHKGKRVRFRVTSDSAITIAVEGLGVSGDVRAGGTREFSVVPRRAGEFAVLVAASDIGVARLIVR